MDRWAEELLTIERTQISLLRCGSWYYAAQLCASMALFLLTYFLLFHGIRTLECLFSSVYIWMDGWMSGGPGVSRASK
jgi:hypothetical protein